MVDGAGEFVRRLIDELHAEAARAEREQARHVFGAGLRAVVEDGVAAARVSLHRQPGAHAVAQAQVDPVARTPAVAVIVAFREEGAEHAVLHVKQRHVLVHRDLEPGGRRGLQQRLELHDIQVIRGRDPFQPAMPEEVGGAEPIGDIERVIAAQAVAAEERKMVVIAHEVAVGVAGQHLPQDPILARLEDARRRHPDGGFGVLGSGFWVLSSGFWVLGSAFRVQGFEFWVLGSEF